MFSLVCRLVWGIWNYPSLIQVHVVVAFGVFVHRLSMLMMRHKLWSFFTASGTGFQAQIKNLNYECWFFQAGHWWTNRWIHSGIFKICDQCVSSLWWFVCKFKELASNYLVINNRYLLCNFGESQNESTTLADMKRVWLSKKFSYIYEASPSTNLAFFMQSLYAHCIGICLDLVVTVN